MARTVEGDETVHRASRGRRPASRNMQPPLTPMIDVTFQLLIFFLLTTQFRMTEGQIPGSLPMGDVSPSQVEIEPVTIKLVPAGANRESAKYDVDKQVVSIHQPEDLYNYLMGRRKQAEDAGIKLPAVVIMPRNDVRWAFVAEAFNQAVRAKFKDIGFGQESMR